MNNIPDLAALLKASNLAEMQHALNPTPENKAKFIEANKAYRDACNIKSITKTPEPKQEEEYKISDDGYWIVHIKTKRCYASEEGLAWMCEVDRSTISSVASKGQKCPEALLDIDIQTVAKIANPLTGREIIAIPSTICTKVLYYYAHKARDHKKRVMAKQLCEAMIDAGAIVFIAKKAGYELDISQGKLVDEVMELKQRMQKLEKMLTGSEFANEGRNQYGETPREAYFRKRDNWKDMYSWIRNWKRKAE